MQTLERVVVTGVGVASPLGCSVREFWDGLVAGRGGVVALTHKDFAKLATRIGALVPDLEAHWEFGPKAARRMSRSSQLALVAASQALAQAGLPAQRVDSEEVAVVVGSSIGGFSASDGFFREYYLRGTTSPLVIPISMNNGPASNISIRYGFQGPLMAIDAACASAAHAIGYCYNLIRTGHLDLAVTGGADSPFSTGVVEAWCALRALSERNDEPATASRPFSADRDGMVLGEAAGILVLEAESSALRRGQPILAEIVGYGATGDSHHLTQPSATGPERAMRRALADADMRPEQIDAINAHGTATRWNDKIETAAIKRVFGDQAYTLPVSGLKGALGHAIGASAALQVISCIQSIHHSVVPPTINYRVPDPDCDLDYVTSGARQQVVDTMMSNAFAFGGSNAVLIVRRYATA
jgi:3-oxoacyl-[acyl-carrier-protein] synthase II